MTADFDVRQPLCRSLVVRRHRRRLALPGCAATSQPRTRPDALVRELSSWIVLHGRPLELHLSIPQQPAGDGVLVLYASGDGGWFGTAVDMFRLIGGAGYYGVGFSARSFLKLHRPRKDPSQHDRACGRVQQILEHARGAMHLDKTTPAILTGWSRGAAFGVLVGSEPVVRSELRGVIAIGLSEGEDLQVNGTADETDEGHPSAAHRPWPFEPYARISGLGELPCAVIQASGDNYLPASRAHELFGPEAPVRRFYTVDATNHRFSGGRDGVRYALLDAIHWMAPRRGIISAARPGPMAAATRPIRRRAPGSGTRLRPDVWSADRRSRADSAAGSSGR